MSCPHPKNKKTQFASPGGAFSRSLPTTTCDVCDAPGDPATHTLTALGFKDHA